MPLAATNDQGLEQVVATWAAKTLGLEVAEMMGPQGVLLIFAIVINPNCVI